MAISRRNSALTFFLNGRRAKDLHGLVDEVGNPLDAYDVAVQRAKVGLLRRAAPAASRSIRAQYNVKAGALSGKLRIEEGLRGRRGDRDDLISIWASTRRIPLIEFGGRWSGTKSPGATAEIERGGRKTYGSSFIATVKGRRSIRVRKRDSTGKRYGRGPLQMLRGPSPFEMLSGVGGHEPSMRAREQVVSELTVFYLGELRRQFRLRKNT